jgi:hypothetical protein
MSLKASIYNKSAASNFNKNNVKGAQFDITDTEWQYLLYVLGNLKALKVYAVSDRNDKDVIEDGSIKVPSSTKVAISMPS